MSKPKFHVGDRVWHPEYGWCTVKDYERSSNATHPYWCYLTSLKYHRWFGWWELFYDEVELPNPHKPEPEIDWRNVPEGTPVDVRDSDICKWKRRKFLTFSKKTGKFWALNNCDEKRAITWNKCRIAEEVEIKDEWLKK